MALKSFFVETCPHNLSTDLKTLNEKPAAVAFW